MKQITITVPDNCELKQDGNTYTIVEKEKKLTYEDVARELFNDNGIVYYTDDEGTIKYYLCEGDYTNHNNCVSRKQAEKLLAINKLMNVAKYLNGDWKPDWSNMKEFKYYVYYSNGYKTLYINNVLSTQDNIIFFKSKEIAQQAIEILGEETIKLALCTDY